MVPTVLRTFLQIEIRDYVFLYSRNTTGDEYFMHRKTKNASATIIIIIRATCAMVVKNK